MTHRLTPFLAVVALAFATTANAASYTTLSVNFGADEPDGARSDVDGAAGVTDSLNWNNVDGASGSAGSLVNMDGAATGAAVEWSSPNTWSSTGRGEEANQGTGEDRDLMTGYLDTESTGGATADVTFSGLSSVFGSVPYSVFVYVQGGVNGRGGDYTIGADTQSLTSMVDFSDPGSVAYPNEFILGEDYLVFTGVSGDGFTLTSAAMGDGTQRAPINGVEIVGFVPEPSTVVLAGMSLIGLGLVARRRR